MFNVLIEAVIFPSTGILVQLPLPKHINEEKVLTEISIEKDVDGFHPLNIGKLAMKGREPLFQPCTPKVCLSWYFWGKNSCFWCCLVIDLGRKKKAYIWAEKGHYGRVNGSTFHFKVSAFTREFARPLELLSLCWCLTFPDTLFWQTSFEFAIFFFFPFVPTGMCWTSHKKRCKYKRQKGSCSWSQQHSWIASSTAASESRCNCNCSSLTYSWFRKHHS